MSSTLPFDFFDRLTEFQQLLGKCRQTMENDHGNPDHISTQIENLEDLVQDYLLPLPMEVLPPQYQQKWLSVKTELQRTSRLLKTEFVFWRSARSPERRQQYQTRLLAHYQQLTDFARALEQWLGHN